MPPDLNFLTIAQAGEMIRTRKISPVELTQALLDRIETFDSQVHSFITLTADRALTEARKAEADILNGLHRGPLHGIPFGLKDIYNTAGVLTTGNSKVGINNSPLEDATAMTRLHQAGGILLGKLATHEFAHGGPSHDLPWPVPRNPWDLECFVGGSSSGSAAAVAAGFALGALGTDTGASIRSPAALAGIAGLKPTYGLVSRHGVIPNSFTFDHCGPMAWTVEDCAILLQTIAGHDPKDPTSSKRSIPDYQQALKNDLLGVKIGVVRHFWEEDLPACQDVCNAMDTALDVLASLGATIDVVRMRPLQDYYDVKVIIAETEIFCIHLQDLSERPDEFGADFLRRTLAGCLFQASDYVHAQRERRAMIDEIQPLYEKYDVLITAAAGPAPRLDQYQNLDFWSKPSIYTVFNVTAGPAISVCNGFNEGGLPLGMQIAGKPFNEEKVLRVGFAYEAATAWRARRPQLVPNASLEPIMPIAKASPRQISVQTRQIAELAAQRAGLRLNQRAHDLLCEAAPYALEMAKRIRRTRSWADEPASIFICRD